MKPFKATITHRDPGGGWVVSYFDTPITVLTDLNTPAGVSRHRFHWTARLAAWIYMRRTS